MTDTWYCSNCEQVVELDAHGRCGRCGSDAVTTASLNRPLAEVVEAVMEDVSIRELEELWRRS